MTVVLVPRRARTGDPSSRVCANLQAPTFSSHLLRERIFLARKRRRRTEDLHRNLRVVAPQGEIDPAKRTLADALLQSDIFERDERGALPEARSLRQVCALTEACGCRGYTAVDAVVSDGARIITGDALELGETIPPWRSTGANTRSRRTRRLRRSHSSLELGERPKHHGPEFTGCANPHVATAIDRTQQHHSAAVSANLCNHRHSAECHVSTAGRGQTARLRFCTSTRAARQNHNLEHAALVADA